MAGPIALGIIGGLTSGGGAGVLSQAVQSSIAPGPSSSVSPGALLKAALQIQALSEQGLTPVFSADPFGPGFTVSTEQQASRLLQLQIQRELSRTEVLTEEEVSEIRDLRDIIIEAGRRQSVPVDQILPVIPPTTRVTARLIQDLDRPVVVRGARTTAFPVRESRSSRLAGACAGAGANTAINRIRCAGGLA